MSKRNQNIVLNASAQEFGKQTQILRELLPVHFRDEIDKNYHIRALNSHLILSSSAGSLMVTSGSLHILASASGDVPGFRLSGSGLGRQLSIVGADGAPTIRLTSTGSTGLQEYLIQSVGSTGLFRIFNQNAGTTSFSISGSVDNVTIRGTLINDSSRLTLSSSVAGSVVAISGTLLITNSTTNNALITRRNILNDTEHLILSCSAGSQTAVSGNFFVIGSGTWGPLFNAVNGYPTSSLTIHGGLATSSLGHERSILSFFNSQEGTSWPQIATFALGRWRLNGTAPESSLEIRLKNIANGTDEAEIKVVRFQSNGVMTAPTGHLILSSSVGSVVAVSGNLDLPSQPRICVIRDTDVSSTTQFIVFESATVSQNITTVGFTFSGGRVTVPSNGKGTYYVECTLYLESNSSTATDHRLSIFKNGVEHHFVLAMAHSSVDPVERTLAILMDLNGGDIVDVRVDSSTTTSLTAKGGCVLNMWKIA